ncbi:hypothetical protein SKAU_G00045740 [Synaphobranchus kaupii]|uniref:Uncharacterized protein n=1 Tax=Synaphobranchus kaupii TaxID=118154 RepID=A0A9Q1J731_SYNKA|nr:hypothetical protein SKAU_G00045740 [Synaphobranchus kaupii]
MGFGQVGTALAGAAGIPGRRLIGFLGAGGERAGRSCISAMVTSVKPNPDAPSPPPLRGNPTPNQPSPEAAEKRTRTEIG